MIPRPKLNTFRFRPHVSEFEDRSVPATLDLTGTTLTFTLDDNAAASMSGNDLALTFDAGAGHTINLTGAAAGNGFAGGAQTSTGSLAALIPVTQLNIVGGAGVETFTITTTGGTFPAFDVAASVETTALNVALGFDTGVNNQTYNGPVTLLADSTLSGGSIALGSTVNGAFNLGVTATAAATFVGAVGGVAPLVGLTVNADTLTAAAVATTGGVNVTTTGAAAVTGVVSGAGALNKGGAGTLTLSGANTYTGITSVNAGTLVAANPTALGTPAGNTFLGANTTLDVQADIGTEPITEDFANLITSGAGVGTVGGPVTMLDNLNIGGDGTLNLNGVIDGAFGLTKVGAGFTTLAGANTYTGATTVAAGTLVVTNAAALGTAAAGTTVAAGAVLNVRADIGVEPISIAGTGIAGNGALRTSTGLAGTVGGPVTLTADASIGNGTGAGGGTLTINGVISGGFALSFTGLGTTTLTAANTYTGLTTVTSGTVVLAGSVPGQLLVTGGTFGGNGTVGAAFQATGGTVAPAAGAVAPATLKVGNTVLGAGATFAPVIGLAGDVTGHLAVTGTVQLLGAALNVTGNPLPAGQTFVLIDNDGTDAVTGTFAGLPQGATVTAGGIQYLISYTGGTGNDVTLTPAAAPAGLSGALGISGQPNGTAGLFLPDLAGKYPTTPTATLSPFGGAAVNVRTASADVNGDGTPDTVLVTGPGVPIRVAVISGVDNTTVLVAPFDPFGGDFTGGGFVTAADVDGDGKAEFAVTPDQGGGPRVSIYTRNTDGTTALRANFFGIDDPTFRGGARAAFGDVNADGTPDLIVCAGFLGGPRTAVFNGTTLFATPARLVNDFFAFPGTDAQTLRNGVFVASGDVNGDGFDDQIFPGGPGGAPRVFILSGALVSVGNVSGAQAAPVANFFVAGNTTDRGGVRLAAKDADGDNKADVVVGSGEGSPANVRVYLGASFTGTGEPATFQDISAFGGVALPGGVFVG
jgi:fibronectin-binding autotransporter adhesin